jgi:ribosomal-protein-alanine N-acetyltransferase
MTTLFGRRVMLRPLHTGDYPAWREVRTRNSAWLTRWEPSRPPNAPDVIGDPHAFTMRCNARQRERQLGVGHGFGVFVDGRFSGEMNLSNIIRGGFQNAHIGYWIDEAVAGHGYTPEALVVVLRFGFDELGLHRHQISIIPRNTASRRVVEKLGIRCEGLAERYLEIDGRWEDHLRFAITSEEWEERRAELTAAWL